MTSQEPSVQHSIAGALREVDVSEGVPERGSGARIGRYVLAERLPDRGVGALYAAHDTELDRTVALRLIPMRDDDGTRWSRDRLLRATRSMARLSHPNIIRIFDAGTTKEDLFIAMERLDAESAFTWIDRDSPAWPEVLATFVRAGYGLAAAHAEGFVHGDFDAHAIQRTAAGRVVVTDFGLTRARTLADGMTNPGTDARLVRDDQYAFCSALYESLFHEPPPVTANALEGRPAVRDAAVPPHVLRVLARGLGRTQRFETMEALLTALEPPARRGRWMIAAAGVVLVGGVAVASGMRDETARCDVVPLSPTTRATAVEAVRASEQPHAEDSARIVEDSLDAWTHAWSSAWLDACEAGTSAPSPCLDRAASRAKALVEALPTAGAERAAPAVLRLGDPRACDDPTPALQTRDEAWALYVLGEHDRALARLQSLEPTGPTLSLLGLVEAAAGASQAASRSLQTAYDETATPKTGLALARLLLDELGRPERAAVVLRALPADLPATLRADRVELDARLAQGEGRTEDARALLAEAEATLAKLGPAARLDATSLALRRGAFEVSAGDYDAAMEHFRRAKRERADMFGLSHPLVAEALAELAGGWIGQGELVAARDTLQTAVTVFAATYPPEHPTMLLSRGRLALLLGMTGRMEQSLAMFEEVVELESRNDENSADVAKTLTNRAVLLIEAGRVREAKADLDRALAIRKTLEDKDGQASVLSELANIALDRDDPMTAERLARESLALHEETLGVEHPILSPALVLLGDALFAQPGHESEARAAYRRALTLVETTQGSDHLNVAFALAGLGRLDAREGEVERARTRLERSVALLEWADFDAELEFECRLELASLDWHADHRDIARQQAKDALTDARKRHPRSVASIEAWLRDHGGR